MAGKKYYEPSTTEKRMHFTLSPDTQKQIKTLQVMLAKSEDELITLAVETLFKEKLAELARKEGILGD